VLVALLLCFAVACTALALATARGAWRRDLDLGDVRGWYPRALPRRLRGMSAATTGGLIAIGAGTYAALMWLALLGVIQNWS
jgi:hypothetical protein